MSENITNTISGNTPAETLEKTNSLLETFLRFFKSCLGISEDEEIEMQILTDARTEKNESEKEYRETVVNSLEEIKEYVEVSVSSNGIESVSGNGFTVSGNLPNDEFYDSMTSYMETSIKNDEETLDYIKSISAVSILIMCCCGFILGNVIALNFSRWWKHG